MRSIVVHFINTVAFERRCAMRAGCVLALLLSVSSPAFPLGLEKAVVIFPSGADAALLSPAGLWYDEARGYLLVADPLLHRVFVLDRKGDPVKVLGKSGDLRFPRAVAASRGGTLYVAGRESEAVKIASQYDSLSGEEFRTLDLSPFRRSAPVQPVALFADSNGDLFVADRGNRQVLAIGADGKLRFSITDVGEPADVVVDRSGKIYVADPGFGGIRLYDGRGNYLRTLGTQPSQLREPLRPKALAVDLRGRIWVLDEGGRGIRALDVAGNPLFFMGGDGLLSPADLAIDAQDNLYVLEEAGRRISVFSIAGM
jgi:sugar lactone lactonase YvrE